MKKFDIDLFKKITYVHFLTDYNSNDFPYPPLFVWDDFKEERKLRDYLKKVKDRFSEVDGLNIYVHFPFCRYKCTFCRQFCFASKNPEPYDEYLQLLIKELKMWIEAMELPGKANIKSLYLGGGTPTNFDLRKFFYAISEFIDLKNAEQIDIESTMDPLLDPQKLTFLKELKLNQKTRLLIGIQSFDERVLKKCHRYSHQKRIYPQVMKNVKKLKIPRIGFDLMLGLPGQSKESFLRDLKFLIKEKIKIIHNYIFLEIPLTPLGRKKKKLKIGPKKRKEIKETIFLAKKILTLSNYLHTGGDWVLNESKKLLNYQQLHLSFPFKKGKRAFNIPIGPSARGVLPFFYERGTPIQNTDNLNLYRERILNNKFTVGKIWKIKSDSDFFGERKGLIRVLRYDYFNKSSYRKIYGRDPEKDFPEEFKFLEKTLTKFNKFERNGDILKFKENIGGHLILSKVFYGPKILRKCRAVIEKKYNNLDFDLGFLPCNEDFI